MAVLEGAQDPAVVDATAREGLLRARDRLARCEVALRGRDGESYTARPIRPADAASLMRGYEALENRAKWFRMLHSLPHLPEAMALDFCTPDPERDFCLVVEGRGPLRGEILGGARISGAADGVSAEFSVSFRPEARGLGLAQQAMEIVFAAAQAMGYAKVWASIHADNAAMVKLARRLRCEIRRDPEDGSLLLAEHHL